VSRAIKKGEWEWCVEKGSGECVWEEVEGWCGGGAEANLRSEFENQKNLNS